MNDKILDIIGLAEEKYLLEAEAQPARKIKHHRKFSAGMIAAAAAAAVMTVTAGAVAVAKLTHKENVEHYYNEKMASEIEQQGYADGQVTENGHVRMTLENLLVDENYAYGVVTVECLDEEGYRAFGEVPVSLICDENGRNIENVRSNHMISNFGLENIGGNRAREAYLLQLYLRGPFDQEKAELPENITVRFVSRLGYSFDEIMNSDELPKTALDGLSFNIGTVPNVSTVRLRSQGGHVGIVSQFMYDFTYNDNSVTSRDYADLPDTMLLRYADGTERMLYDKGTKEEKDFTPEAGSSDDENGECDIRGRFLELIDLTGLTEIEFAGEIYKVI